MPEPLAIAATLDTETLSVDLDVERAVLTIIPVSGAFGGASGLRFFQEVDGDEFIHGTVSVLTTQPIVVPVSSGALTVEIVGVADAETAIKIGRPVKVRR